MKSNASFVIPVYNGEKYLPEAIRSCLAQSTMPDAIIVVDDASTDRSSEIIKDYARRYPDVIVPVFREANGGRSIARNSGIAKVATKYCLFLDADDLAEPNRVERQVSFMEHNPDVFASSSFVVYIDSKGRPFSRGKLDVLTREQYNAHMAKDEVIGFFTSATIVRTSVFLEERVLFREVFRQAQDMDLWTRISERHVILAQPEYLAQYRIHGDSVTMRKYRRSRLYYEYARDCMRRRRHGNPERTWEEFRAFWSRRPLHERIEGWRKTTAKKCFHNAGFAFAERRPFSFVTNLVSAVVLQPTYAVPRMVAKFRR